MRVKMREMAIEHIQVVSDRLQLTIAGLFAGWAQMIAFHEQHLRDFLPVMQ
jgi:hypothetical protein